jgi:hypothetical protein
LHGGFEAAGLGADPIGKLRNTTVRFQLRDRVVFAFHFFFGQKLVNLRVAGPAEPDYLPNDCSIELALVPLIMVTGPRNEVMPRESFFAATSRAGTHASKHSKTIFRSC